MATGVGNDSKLRWIRAILVAVILLGAVRVDAAQREIELFDEGYEYYLSYKPDRAADAFGRFLKEFPGSTSKDAALFWLGKSLIQMQSYEEARKVFIELNREFPESPFVMETDKTLEILPSTNPVRKTESVSNARSEEKDVIKERLAEIEKKARLTEKDLSKAVEERDRLVTLLEEEKRKTQEMGARMAMIREDMAEKRGDEEKRRAAALEARLSNIEEKTGASGRELSKVLADTERLRRALEEQIAKTEEMRTGLARPEDRRVEPGSAASVKKTGDASGERETDEAITVEGRVVRIYEEERAIALRDELGKVVVVFFEDEKLFKRIGRLHITLGEKVLIRYVPRGETNIGTYIRSLSFC